jgi:hypothetical protein
MKLIKYCLLIIILQFSISNVVNADASDCVYASKTGLGWAKNYNNCVDMFDKANTSGETSILGFIFSLIIFLLFMYVMFLAIVGIYVKYQDNPKKKLTGRTMRAQNLDAHLTKPELIIFAKEEGVKVKSRDTKAQIIENLLTHWNVEE